MGNDAKCKQFATPIAMRKSTQKLKEYQGGVEETGGMSRKPWQPQGGIENPRSPREAGKAVGRPGSWEGSGEREKMQKMQNNAKNAKEMQKNVNKCKNAKNARKSPRPSGI